MSGPFGETAVLLGIYALAGIVFVWPRHPALIAYIVVGILVGPAGCLDAFEPRRPYRELAVERQSHPKRYPQVVVFGLGRYRGRLLTRLHATGLLALSVDFDP